MNMIRPSYVTEEALEHFVKEALREDIGPGDYSTLASISPSEISKAKLLVKEPCVLAGVELADYIFKYYDKDLVVNIFKKDGEKVEYGDIVLEVSGKAQSILSVERLVLNCLQRMSGIATRTHAAVELLEGAKTKLLDTRKTTPNFRMCEKWAVYIGGGTNHRFGLYDMIMLKDNHVDFAGGITQAVQKTRDYLKQNNLSLKIELEVRNLQEVEEALATGGVDIIMLDNMSIEEMKTAVDRIGEQAETEASGNITNETMALVATTGVDFISSGAIIYNAPVVDLSLKAEL